MLQCLVIFLVSITTIAYSIRYLVRGGRKGKLVDKIPGPYAWPIFGNTFQFLVPIEELWIISRKLNKKYYPINRIWSVFDPVVNIYHPDDVEALLSSMKHIEKSPLYNFFHPWLGTGLLTSTGAKWHERRRILTAAFHFNVLKQFVGIFIEQSDKLVESLCLEGEDEIVHDLVPLLHKYTLNSICETAMGSKAIVDARVQKEYRSCVSEMGELIIHRLIRPWLHADWMFKFSKRFKEQVRALKVLHGFSTKIISERKQYHKEANSRYLKELAPDNGFGSYTFDEEHVKGSSRTWSDEILLQLHKELAKHTLFRECERYVTNTKCYPVGKRRLAMLDLLISASERGQIDDEGIREEVDTFIFEGHDTTAMALCFSLLLLAENKEIQDKARAEVDTVFGQREDRKLSLKEIQSLVYLERCIKESLRLFPSVPFITRQITEDLQLKNYLIPTGALVHVHIRDLHQDPNFWPEPDVFDPDRFLPDQVQGRHPFAFVPFSAGPRNCIGQRFAMLELKALIGNFLHNFYLEPIDFSSDVRILPDLVLRPITPVRIKIIRRSHDD